MLKRATLFIASLIFATSTTLHPEVICDQLSTLSPGIMRFLAHPAGKLIAAQEAYSGSKTHVAFYEFQKGTDGGKKPQLSFLTALNNESGQGIFWDWTNTKQLIALATLDGRLSVYQIPTAEDIAEYKLAPILVGEKNKFCNVKALKWNTEEDAFAIVLDKKLVIYALNPESKKRPLKRLTSIELSLDNVTFLSWSHDGSLIAVGDSQKLAFYKTRTPSGIPKLAPYASPDLDQVLKSIQYPLKDIAWNKTGAPTIALLGKRMALITFPRANTAGHLGLHQNFASNIAGSLAWNFQETTGPTEGQELVVASTTGRSYQVYTLTDKSLLFDTAPHEFLPPYKQPEAAKQQDRFTQKSTKKHTLFEATLIELINKMATQQS